jgi:hypothetical protein
LSTFDHDEFAGSDDDDINPDFKESLAKFFDYAKRGVDIRKTASDRKELEQYGRVVVRSEIGGELGEEILALHAARGRVAKEVWAKYVNGPTYLGTVRDVLTHAGLTGPMRGACLALIT